MICMINGSSSSIYFFVFFFNDTATTEIYTLSLHDAPSDLRRLEARQVRRERRGVGGRHARAGRGRGGVRAGAGARPGRRSEEHTSELQSRQYLVCRLLLEKKKKIYREHILITTHHLLTPHV